MHLEKLSWLDRLLPVWILLAMAFGLVLGRLVPGMQVLLGGAELGNMSLPIALGLMMMMYPVLAKVRYGELGYVARDRSLLTTSLLLLFQKMRNLLIEHQALKNLVIFLNKNYLAVHRQALAQLN